ncbi:hypothetical protein CMV_029485 [Castanea mollissima]|uniref:Leucine-rich repeat-containing N-terminal plant-type domain-containing protein n=1 Tax=Castanea mollissima TaxID=60419 RepID=A0A8J4Q2Z7_9ROSI|nr:hypothetical protein CMV_029485 [Castanea mollissima]
MYNVTRNWQGDPCIPSEYLWDGLNCNDNHHPRIISLNLSSSNMTGEIAISFFNLKAMQSLDLSYNDLTRIFGTTTEFEHSVLVLLFIFSALDICRRKRQGVDMVTNSNIKSKNQHYSYS